MKLIEQQSQFYKRIIWSKKNLCYINLFKATQDIWLRNREITIVKKYLGSYPIKPLAPKPTGQYWKYFEMIKRFYVFCLYSI